MSESKGKLAYMDEATEISFNNDIAICDSLYIAVARRKDLNLLTTDELQTRAAAAVENISVPLKG